MWGEEEIGRWGEEESKVGGAALDGLLEAR